MTQSTSAAAPSRAHGDALALGGHGARLGLRARCRRRLWPARRHGWEGSQGAPRRLAASAAAFSPPSGSGGGGRGGHCRGARHAASPAGAAARCRRRCGCLGGRRHHLQLRHQGGVRGHVVHGAHPHQLRKRGVDLRLRVHRVGRIVCDALRQLQRQRLRVVW